MRPMRGALWCCTSLDYVRFHCFFCRDRVGWIGFPTVFEPGLTLGHLTVELWLANWASCRTSTPITDTPLFHKLHPAMF